MGTFSRVHFKRPCWQTGWGSHWQLCIQKNDIKSYSPTLSPWNLLWYSPLCPILSLFLFFFCKMHTPRCKISPKCWQIKPRKLIFLSLLSSVAPRLSWELNTNTSVSHVQQLVRRLKSKLCFILAGSLYRQRDTLSTFAYAWLRWHFCIYLYMFVFICALPHSVFVRWTLFIMEHWESSPV